MHEPPKKKQHMKRTHSDVRKKCREMFGVDWWNVEVALKKQRQAQAIAQLTVCKPASVAVCAIKQIVLDRIPCVDDLTVVPVLCSLYECYDTMRRTMTVANEKRWLFHGTTADAAPRIVAEGFNRSFCGRNATLYGKGVYFAADVAYSAQSLYSQPDENGYKHIVAARVLVGTSCLGRPDQHAPDIIDSTHRYDSTVDRHSNPSIYVVYRDMQALPEFLIRFKNA